MKVTIQELEACEVLMTIEVEPARAQELLKKAAQRIARQVKIPGFRPGKAPLSTIVRRFGWEAVQREALERSTSEKLITQALEEAKVEPYGQMELADVSWDPLLLRVKIPVKPQVELGNYRELRLEVEPIVVMPEEVEQTLKALQEQQATWVPVERPAEIGDLLSMTVIEKEGDTVLGEQQAVEYELTPVEVANPGQPDITSHLLGLSAGESKTFTVNYPAEIENKRYAGKEITFTVEVTGVKVKELDPLDDDFAQQVSDLETLDQLKGRIRENIKRQREQQRDFELGYQAVDKLVESAPQIAWPLVLEEEKIKEEIQHYETHLKEKGMTLAGYLKVENKTFEELQAETRAKVITGLKRGLVLNKIAELEKLEVNQSEILEQAKLIDDYAGANEQFWREVLTSDAQQNVIARDLLSNKALYRLAAIAKGEAPEPGAEMASPSDEAADDVEVQDQTSLEPASEPILSTSQATTDEDNVKNEAAAPDTKPGSSEVTSDTSVATAADNIAAEAISAKPVQTESTDEPVTTQV